jgi:hypothetical protein
VCGRLATIVRARYPPRQGWPLFGGDLSLLRRRLFFLVVKRVTYPLQDRLWQR